MNPSSLFAFLDLKIAQDSYFSFQFELISYATVLIAIKNNE